MRSQTGFAFLESIDVRELYEVFARAIRAAGGLDWLVASLDREPSYVSKISAAVNRHEGRFAHLDWLVPILADREGARVLLEWMCDRCGYEPPQPKRVATREELLGALLDELDDAGAVGDAVLERAARRVGADRGSFRR